jgi:hypothetical protein
VSTITIVRRDDGKLAGFSRPDERAYAKYRAAIAELEVGELFTFSVWFPRNPKFHKFHFGVIGALFDAQERYDNLDDLRRYLYVGAGYADFLPAPGYLGDIIERLPKMVQGTLRRLLLRDVELIAVPKSISYSTIDDADFRVLHDKVVDFKRGTRARKYLWPHLTDAQTHDTVEAILESFERQ